MEKVGIYIRSLYIHIKLDLGIPTWLYIDSTCVPHVPAPPWIYRRYMYMYVGAISS